MGSRLGPSGTATDVLNISVDELVHPGCARTLAAVLQQTGLAPARLTLEITETGLILDPVAAARALAAVTGLGCQLAIDDFGTGYSSLSRLVNLPAGTWKIDRSFFADLTARPAAAAVVAAVDNSAVSSSAIEGVEDDITVHALRKLGGRHAQRFHLGRPQPPRSSPRRLSPGAGYGTVNPSR